MGWLDTLSRNARLNTGMRLVSDIVTRPIGGLLLTLPIVLVCWVFVLLLWPSPRGGLLLGDYISAAWYRDLQQFPPDFLALAFVSSWAAFGGSISSISFLADQDLPSSLRVPAICLIQAVLGIACGMMMYIVLTAFLHLILRDLNPSALSPYVLGFLAFVCGIMSDRVLAVLRAVGIRAFEITVVREPQKTPTSKSGDQESEGSLPESKDDRSESSTQFGRQLSAIEDRISSLQIRPMLDNFDGIVSVQLCDTGGSDLPVDDSKESGFAARAKTAQHCQVRLRLGTSEHLGKTGFQKPVQIKNGTPSDSVTFHVAVDCNDIEFKPGTDRVTFGPEGQSRLMTFLFRAPDKPGSFDLFAEVSQKGRVIAVVALTLAVA